MRISIRADEDGTAYSRPMASITCQDCGEQRQRCPANTRYCKKCRLLRELDYWHHRVRTCRGAKCSEVFAPLGRDDYYCSTCDPGLRAHAGPCGLTPDFPHDGRPIYSQIPICAVCLRSPQKRTRLITVLANGQAARRKANA